MWDSINGTLLPPGFGSSSPNINLSYSPTMGMGMSPILGNSLAQVPYGGYGMPMFPGGMAGLPYDNYSFSRPNTPPLKTHGKSFWESIPTALKVIGGVAVAALAFKFLKGKRLPSKPPRTP